MKVNFYQRTEKSDFNSENEDCMIHLNFSLMNDKCIDLCIVADGMGGMYDAKGISHMCAEKFACSFFENLLKNYDFEKSEFSISNYRDRFTEIIYNSMRETNSYICNTENINSESGTTLSAVVIADDFAVITNVGDSPIYYYNSQEKSFTIISDIQNRAHQKYSVGAYERFSDEYNKDSNFLTNYIGKYDELSEKLIYITTVEKLRENDSILICTDGATGYRNENEIHTILFDGEGDSIERLKKLFDTARKDKEDDRTAILINF